MDSKGVLAIGLIVAFIIGAAIGYVAKPSAPAEAKTVTVTQTITQGAPGAKTVTQTVTKTVTQAGAAPGGVLAEIKKRGKIVVATSPDWPPFEFIDPKTNKIVGYEVDIMEEVAKKLGVKVEWKPMDFDAIIQAVKNKEVDMGVSGFSVTPERLKEVLFTMPIHITKVQLIMLEPKAKELGITTLGSLEEAFKYNLVIGTGSGTTEEDELLQLVKQGKLKSSQVKSYPDFEVALEDMKKGTIDAVYAETPITTYWNSTSEVPLKVVYSRSYWPVAFVLHKDAIDLMKEIDGILAEMYANAKIDEIADKWGVPKG